MTQVAERRGWTVVETYRDAGIGGTKGRDQRPGQRRHQRPPGRVE
ncbi:MAG: hypothetical protein WAO08_27525, partial [Hyphomicrobiaceae bacterium]